MGALKKYVYIMTAGILLAGCATDPLTETLKRLEYAPAMPAPATQYIGDVYEKPNLKEPYLLLKEYCPREELDTMMKGYSDTVSIPDSSGEKTYKVSMNADIIGKANAELSTNGIMSFKVKFNGVRQYLISKTKFHEDIAPKLGNIIRKISEGNTPDLFDLNKKFAILALLQVDNLEYEFYDNKGAKVNVSPGSQLEQILKANLGVDWSANQKSNLSFHSPRFIGYRMGMLSIKTRTYYSTVPDPVAGNYVSAANPASCEAIPKVGCSTPAPAVCAITAPAESMECSPEKKSTASVQPTTEKLLVCPAEAPAQKTVIRTEVEEIQIKEVSMEDLRKAAQEK